MVVLFVVLNAAAVVVETLDDTVVDGLRVMPLPVFVVAGGVIIGVLVASQLEDVEGNVD